MEYLIRRTSDYLGEEKPCRQAYKSGEDMWGNPIWYVDIHQLEQLQDIVRETGHSLILHDNEIEIYDDYRE